MFIRPYALLSATAGQIVDRFEKSRTILVVKLAAGFRSKASPCCSPCCSGVACRPLLISETGAEGRNGAGWLRYVGGEVRAARRAGVPVHGVCLYPVMDYPGWQNDRACRCGLIRIGEDWRERSVDEELLEQLAEERMLLATAPGTGV